MFTYAQKRHGRERGAVAGGCRGGVSGRDGGVRGVEGARAQLWGGAEGVAGRVGAEGMRLIWAQLSYEGCHSEEVPPSPSASARQLCRSLY